MCTMNGCVEFHRNQNCALYFVNNKFERTIIHSEGRNLKNVHMLRWVGRCLIGRSFNPYYFDENNYQYYCHPYFLGNSKCKIFRTSKVIALHSFVVAFWGVFMDWKIIFSNFLETKYM